MEKTTPRKIIGLVLARGGSKGVPNKNIRPLNGKPLMLYVLEEMKKLSFFDGIYVSTDSRDIAEVGVSCNVNIIRRPAIFATDEAKSIDAVNDMILRINQSSSSDTIARDDYIVLVNACCPLTKAEDIASAVKMALENNADSVVSLVEDFSAHPTKICDVLDNGAVVPLTDVDKFETYDRAVIGKVYKRNAAIYIAKRKVIESGTFFGPDTRGYVMPKERSWDINDMFDWNVAELLIKQRA